MRSAAAWSLGAVLAFACGGGGDDSAGGSSSGAAASTTNDTTISPTTTGDPATTDDPTSTTGTGTTDDTTGAAIVCDGNCHYIRAGAAGSGADWSDALPELPATLERGHVYYVAAGDYPAYTFDDPEAGDAAIRILRATDADHGADVGWDASYAAGEAVFGELVFATGRHEFDCRGAARVVGGFESTVVDIAAPAVTFRGCDVDGAFAETDGKHTGGACTAMTISGDDVIVEGNHIHDAADDGVVMSGLVNLQFSGNTVHALYGCGTDGECGPCYNGHSDGLELFDVADSDIVGNVVYDVRSTAAVFFGNWADELGMGEAEYCENVLLANNIFYSPETGFVVYIEDARGVIVMHNVIWGLHQGAYGGLSIGTHVADLDLYNNVILSINYNHIGGMYDPAEHRGDHNLFAYSLGQWQDGANDLVAVDPGFSAIPGGEGPTIANPMPAAFTPKPDSPLRDAGWPGDANLPLPADFFGNPRDATPNIGAIE